MRVAATSAYPSASHDFTLAAMRALAIVRDRVHHGHEPWFRHPLSTRFALSTLACFTRAVA